MTAADHTCPCGQTFAGEGTVHGHPAGLWALLSHQATDHPEGKTMPTCLDCRNGIHAACGVCLCCSPLARKSDVPDPIPTTPDAAIEAEVEELRAVLDAADVDFSAREFAADAGRAEYEPGNWFGFMARAAIAAGFRKVTS